MEAFVKKLRRHLEKKRFWWGNPARIRKQKWRNKIPIIINTFVKNQSRGAGYTKKSDVKNITQMSAKKVEVTNFFFKKKRKNHSRLCSVTIWLRFILIPFKFSHSKIFDFFFEFCLNFSWIIEYLETNSRTFFFQNFKASFVQISNFLTFEFSIANLKIQTSRFQKNRLDLKIFVFNILLTLLSIKCQSQVIKLFQPIFNPIHFLFFTEHENGNLFLHCVACRFGNGTTPRIRWIYGQQFEWFTIRRRPQRRDNRLSRDVSWLTFFFTSRKTLNKFSTLTERHHQKKTSTIHQNPSKQNAECLECQSRQFNGCMVQGL